MEQMPITDGCRQSPVRHLTATLVVGRSIWIASGVIDALEDCHPVTIRRQFVLDGLVKSNEHSSGWEMAVQQMSSVSPSRRLLPESVDWRGFPTVTPPVLGQAASFLASSLCLPDTR